MSSKLCTTGEAAAAVKIMRQTLQSWIAMKKIRAPKPTVFAKVTVRMWNTEDLKMLREAKEMIYRKGRGLKRKKVR